MTEKLKSADQPRISVICPVYNSSGFVKETLRSVHDQESLPFELIIIDDGSSDGTPEYVDALLREWSPQFQWTILRTRHKGAGAARNAGIKAASGDWVAFLDSDDIWLHEKLSIIVRAIWSNPEVNFLCHHETMILLDGQTEALDYATFYDHSRDLPQQLYMRNLFSTSAVVCKHDLLTVNGIFDEALMSAQDYELWLRLSPHIRLMFIKERLGLYVERVGNITNGNLFRRLKNEIKIANRHRRKTSTLSFVGRVVRIFGSYCRVAVKRTLLKMKRN